MVLLGSRNFLPGIWETQVGDPLAHSEEELRHCISSDRLAGLLGHMPPLLGSEDKEIAEAGFRVWDGFECRGRPQFSTEGDPPLEGTESSGSSSGHNSGVCGLQRSPEISSEAICGRSNLCCQGSGRG